MSEKDKPELIVTTAPPYDFSFIVQSLGLIPVKGGKEAFNPAYVTNVYRDEEDPSLWVFALYGDETCVLSDSDMPELESQLRLRAEIAKRMFQQQMGGGLIDVPTLQAKRFRQ